MQEPNLPNGPIPSCSLAIITHERSKLFQRCYDSVLCSIEGLDTDIPITIYNSSRDSLVHLIQTRHEECHVPSLRNAVSKRQLAVSRCLTQWLIFLDDDCEIMPDTLRMLGAAISAAADDAGAVFCITGFSGCKSYWFEVFNGTGYLDTFRPTECAGEVPWGTTSLAAFRSESLADVGGFNTAFAVPAGGEDIDICLRLRSHNWRLFFVPKELVLHATATWNNLKDNSRRSFNYGRAELELQRAWPSFSCFNPASLTLLLIIGCIEAATLLLKASIATLLLGVASVLLGLFVGELACQYLTYRKSIRDTCALTIIECLHNIGHLVQAVKTRAVKNMFCCFNWQKARTNQNAVNASVVDYSTWVRHAFLITIVAISSLVAHKLFLHLWLK